MKLEVKNLNVTSLVTSSVPVVIFAVGFLGAMVQFIFMPNPQIVPMNIWQKLLSVGLFSLLYVVIVSALLVFIAFLYNMLTSVLGMRGVVVEMEETGGHE